MRTQAAVAIVDKHIASQGDGCIIIHTACTVCYIAHYDRQRVCETAIKRYPADLPCRKTVRTARLCLQLYMQTSGGLRAFAMLP